MDDSAKYKVISLIQREVDAKEIADDVGVSYSGVLKLRREYQEAKVNGTIDSLLDTSRVLLEEVGQQLSDLPAVDNAVAELTKGLTGLETLSNELQTTAIQLNTRVRSLMLSIDHMSELEAAADIVCKLQVAFVNKNGMQVNIQNNSGGDDGKPKYTQFLGDKPVD